MRKLVGILLPQTKGIVNMKNKTNNIKIVSTGKYLPENIVTNFDLEQIIDTNDEWIFTRTGIKERRRITKETTSDMAVSAALAAIEKGNYDRAVSSLY